MKLKAANIQQKNGNHEMKAITSLINEIRNRYHVPSTFRGHIDIRIHLHGNDTINPSAIEILNAKDVMNLKHLVDNDRGVYSK